MTQFINPFMNIHVLVEPMPEPPIPKPVHAPTAVLSKNISPRPPKLLAGVCEA